ncbi:MAG: hypothetical protein Q3M30_13165 [Candidatus Electrothrix sp. Rat3]|nr:hypothetical protein [Candidatus Electrothrix rattekaaiensis]
MPGSPGDAQGPAGIETPVRVLIDQLNRAKGLLETAIRLKLDLTILLIRDDGFGMIKWKQGGMEVWRYGGRYGLF